MRYIALATDYDGTLAANGVVAPEVVKALEEFRKSGRKLIMVTGREIRHLKEVFPEYKLFDCVVGENGAVIYDPQTDQSEVICERPSQEFVNKLIASGVEPMSVGEAIVATWTPHEHVVLQSIKELGLELEIIFNKGAVMVLPTGVNKGTGLQTALQKMGLSYHNVIGVGDAENDHAFLQSSEVSFSVSNAIDSLKERTDAVTNAARGHGVAEIIYQVLENDLIEASPTRHFLKLGSRDGQSILLDPYDTGILISGVSGGGKSKATLGILEKLSKAGYQFCLVDPEGDYEQFDNAMVTGSTERAPTIEEVMGILSSPERSAIVNLLDVKLEDRPDFFTQLLPRIQEMRTKLGRPHWLVIDEAHHLFPQEWQKMARIAPQDLRALLMITVHPERIAPHIISSVNHLIAVGEQIDVTVKAFARQAGISPPELNVDKTDLEPGKGLLWNAGQHSASIISLDRAETDKVRHRRKYAEGELPEHCSFYFTGPDKKLNLRAQNLHIFIQIGEGIDDTTWLYHLRKKHYSQWITERIKDKKLATDVSRVEADESLSAEESRKLIRDAIEKRYTAAA